MVTVSVVTATFNRAHLLPRLYQSLVAQTSHDFEWVVVDDGSTDGTESVVEEWLLDAGFEIRYLKQANSGKHVALNSGFAAARGDYCFVVDSDDALCLKAIAVARGWIDDVKGRLDIAGVAGLKRLPDGSIPGGSPDFGSARFVECTNLERDRFGLNGDAGAELYRRDVLLAYPFPVFEGETFVHEGFVWNQIARAGLKVRWHNQPIYLGHYQGDGLSARAASLHVENFRGYAAYVADLLPHLSGLRRFKQVGAFSDVARRRNLSSAEVAGLLDVPLALVRLARLAKTWQDRVDCQKLRLRLRGR